MRVPPACPLAHTYLPVSYTHTQTRAITMRARIGYASVSVWTRVYIWLLIIWIWILLKIVSTPALNDDNNSRSIWNECHVAVLLWCTSSILFFSSRIFETTTCEWKTYNIRYRHMSYVLGWRTWNRYFAIRFESNGNWVQMHEILCHINWVFMKSYCRGRILFIIILKNKTDFKLITINSMVIINNNVIQN